MSDIKALASHILEALGSTTESMNFKSLLQKDDFDAALNFQIQPVKLDTLPWAVADDVGPRYGIGAPIKKKGGLDDIKTRLKQKLAEKLF